MFTWNKPKKYAVVMIDQNYDSIDDVSVSLYSTLKEAEDAVAPVAERYGGSYYIREVEDGLFIDTLYTITFTYDYDLHTFSFDILEELVPRNVCNMEPHFSYNYNLPKSGIEEVEYFINNNKSVFYSIKEMYECIS